MIKYGLIFTKRYSLSCYAFRVTRFAITQEVGHS